MRGGSNGRPLGRCSRYIYNNVWAVRKRAAGGLDFLLGRGRLAAPFRLCRRAAGENLCRAARFPIAATKIRQGRKRAKRLSSFYVFAALIGPICRQTAGRRGEGRVAGRGVRRPRLHRVKRGRRGMRRGLGRWQAGAKGVGRIPAEEPVFMAIINNKPQKPKNRR